MVLGEPHVLRESMACISFTIVPRLQLCVKRPPSIRAVYSPPDRKGLLDFIHHAPTQYPARAARQWIEQLASGSRRVSRQSCSPVARQWIPPSIPPERLASGSRRVPRQSGSPVDPAEYPTRRVSHPPSISLSIPE